jgi:hypothetical protein
MGKRGRRFRKSRQQNDEREIVAEVPSIQKSYHVATSSTSAALGPALAGAYVGGGWISDHREEVRHFRHFSYVAIHQIAQQLSSATVTAFADEDNQWDNQSRRKSLRVKFGSLDRYKSIYGKEDDTSTKALNSSHALMKLLAKPNPWESGYDFRYRQTIQIRLTGACYIWNVPSQLRTPDAPNGVPCQRFVIPTAAVTPMMPTAELPYGGFLVQPYCSRYAPIDEDSGYVRGSPGWMRLLGRVVDAREIQKIGYPHPLWLDDWQSPIAAGDAWVDMEEAVNRARTASTLNGVDPSLVWELPPNIKLSPDMMDRTQSAIQKKYGGPYNQSRVLVTESGTKVTPTSGVPKDMCYPEGFQDVKTAILSLHGTPPVAVAMQEPGAYASYIASLKAWNHATINPLCEKFGESDTAHLAPFFGEGLTVEYEPKSIQDPDNDLKLLTILASTKKVIRVNELRAKCDMEPLEGPEGDAFVNDDPVPGMPQAKPNGVNLGRPDAEALKPIVKPAEPTTPFERDDGNKSLLAALEGFREEDEEFVQRKLGSLIEKAVAAKLKSLEPGEEPRKYASTQFNLPDELADQVRKMGQRIDLDDLAEDGLEDEPHVTILYGLTESSPQSVKRALSGFPAGRIELGMSSLFAANGTEASRGGPQFDVLKLDVGGDYIHRIHDRLADKCDYEVSWPLYVPHVTIGYLRPGRGRKYVGMTDVEGETFLADKMTFSNQQKDVSVIRLQPPVKSRQSIIERQLAHSNGNGRTNEWHGKAYDPSEARDESGEWTGGASQPDSKKPNKPSKNAAICQMTGLPFEGRGKNHPKLREVLDDAMKDGARNQVIEAIKDAKNRGTNNIEDFVRIANEAIGKGKEDRRQDRREQVELEDDRRRESRERDDLNRKLRAAGYRWSKEGNQNWRETPEQTPESHFESKWVLRNHQGDVVSLDDAKKEIASNEKSLGMSTGVGDDGGFAVKPELPGEPSNEQLRTLYGNCPFCSGEVTGRDSDRMTDTCDQGHSYPSKLSIFDRPSEGDVATSAVNDGPMGNLNGFADPSEKSNDLIDNTEFGACPLCGQDAIMRERRWYGNVPYDSCCNGHEFPAGVIATGVPKEKTAKAHLQASRKSSASGGQWITLKPHGGNEGGYLHVMIDESGEIQSGPKEMRDKKPNQIESHREVKQKQKSPQSPQVGTPDSQTVSQSEQTKKEYHDRLSNLASSPVKSSKPLSGHRNLNETHIVALKNGDKGVWKPASGETSFDHNGEPIRPNIPAGTQHKREAAASAVADAIGLHDLVPATTLRTMEKGEKKEIGSLQHFSEHGIPAHATARDAKYDGDRDLARAAAFDILTSNTDRHLGNWMVTHGLSAPNDLSSENKKYNIDKEHKLVLIDHGLAFPESGGNGRSGLVNMAEHKKLPVPNEVLKWDSASIDEAMKKNGIEPRARRLALDRLSQLQSLAKDGKTFADGFNQDVIHSY